MKNYLRTILCVWMTLIFAAFALPTLGAGPQKTYSLLIQAAPVYSTDGTTVSVPIAMSVYVKNESPPSSANSNAGSFSFKLVGLTIVGQPSCPSAHCTADPNTNTISVTNISPPIQAQDIFKVSFNVNSCGDGSVTSPAVWTGSQLNGATFKAIPDLNFFNTSPPTVPTASTSTSNIACGVLACTDSVAVSSSINDPRFVVSGQRSGYNANGAAVVGDELGECIPVPYYVTNTLATSDNRLHFEWPGPATGISAPGSDPAAAFIYTVNVPLGSYGLSWLPRIGNPVFISPPFCLGATLPTPYGFLASDVGISDKKIAVANLTGTPPAAPFDIVIGAERMQVTKVTTNQWAVTRHIGGTDGASHSADDPVMYTPLPILQGYTFTTQQAQAGYKNGNQAQMCVQTQGASSTTIIDIGDGWIGQN